MSKWSNKYEIGQKSLDDHHRELFDLTTMLDEAIISNNPKNLEKIILFLEHYSKDHFSEEEELMITENYKGLKHHQHEHEKLSLLIEDSELRKKLGIEGRKTVENNYSVIANEERYLSFFNKLVS